MPSDRDAERLGHIIDNIDRIDDHLNRLTFAQFTDDLKTIDAVERCLQRITEAAIRIGAERMSEIAPDVPFHEVRGLGNALRHEYEKLDLTTLWNTVSDDLPSLRAACVVALSK